MQTIIDDNLVPYESDVVKFIQHVVEGLAYLHHRKIAHLDIKVFPLCNLHANQTPRAAGICYRFVRLYVICLEERETASRHLLQFPFCLQPPPYSLNIIQIM